MQPNRGDTGGDPPRPALMNPVAALERSAPSRSFLDVGHEAIAPARYAFRIGDLGLMLAARTLCEVTAVPVAAPIPGTPDWLLGVTNLRGTLVPVFDLHVLFGLPAAERSSASAGLVIDSGDHAVAIIIDGVPRPLRSLSPLAELPPLPAAIKPFVTAAWVQERAVWLDINHRQLFASLAARMDTSGRRAAAGMP